MPQLFNRVLSPSQSPLVIPNAPSESQKLPLQLLPLSTPPEYAGSVYSAPRLPPSDAAPLPTRQLSCRVSNSKVFSQNPEIDLQRFQQPSSDALDEILLASSRHPVGNERESVKATKIEALELPSMDFNWAKLRQVRGIDSREMSQTRRRRYSDTEVWKPCSAPGTNAGLHIEAWDGMELSP